MIDLGNISLSSQSIAFGYFFSHPRIPVINRWRTSSRRDFGHSAAEFVSRCTYQVQKWLVNDDQPGHHVSECRIVLSRPQAWHIRWLWFTENSLNIHPRPLLYMRAIPRLRSAKCVAEGTKRWDKEFLLSSLYTITVVSSFPLPSCSFLPLEHWVLRSE